MSLTQNTEKLKIRKWDWFLIIGLVLAPMTSLRIGKIGPSELFCFIWSIKNFDQKIRLNLISEFFMWFLLAMVLGSLFCYIFYPVELDTVGLFTWMYIAFIAIVMYQKLPCNSKDYNLKLFYRFAIIATIWYLFLYFVSIYYSKTPFGIPLWFADARYTGGAKNPHQIAILMCGLTFVFLKRAIEKKNVLLNLVFASICVYTELQTEASTGLMAMVLGLFTAIFVLTFNRINDRKRRLLFLAAEICFFIAFFLLFYNKIYTFVYDWIASDRNGVGRLEIASRIGKAFMKSPIFGLGPGTHSVSDYGIVIEFHNTYLEIIAATGIIGATAFIVLTARVIKILFYNDSQYLAVIVAIYAYGFGGFAMRRLVYWGLFVFIIVIAQQTSELNKNPTKDQEV